MAFWKKKNKDSKKLSEEQNQANAQFSNAPVNNNNSHHVIKQQQSQYSVDPEFFDYEKAKLNLFLTDSEEYNRAKLVNDYPNADARYMNISKDKIELERRYKQDEKAFKEIYTNLNNNEAYAEFGFDQIKQKSLRQAYDLNNDEARHPVKTRLVDANFYQEIGNNLDRDLEKISKETRKFLQNMETKILDLNNLEEPLINKLPDYGKGGKQTTKDYILDNTVVNKYSEMAKDQGIDSHYDESILTTKDFENLKTQNFRVSKSIDEYQVENKEALENRQELLKNNNKTIEFNNVVKNEQEEIPSIAINQARMNKTREILEQAQTIDQILNREITKEIDQYERNVEATKKNITNLLKEAESINNSFEKKENNVQTEQDNLCWLVPVNEIKMDLRVRKAEKRNFVFNPKGHF